MLSEKAQYLLTGFVDGVLTREEREAAERLLRESSEARNWLRQLQENIHRLKKLPRRRLHAEFSDRVMAQLPEVPLETAPVLVHKPNLRRGLPGWVVGTVAASVVVVAGAGGLWWVSQQVEIDRNLLPTAPAPAPMVREH